MSKNNLPINVEVFNLLEFANMKKTGGRSELFTTITDFLERRHSELSSNELSLMSDILAKLIRDVEMGVRRNLSERLVETSNAPIELIILLANDDIDVALPILTLSKMLTDQDLIKIIHHKTVQHQLGIASRQNLSSDVCSELISIGTTKTLIALINNKNTRIKNQSLVELVEKSRNNIPIQSPLIERPDLPKELAARMYQWVSDHLKQSILMNFNLNPADIESLLETVLADIKLGDTSQITTEKSEILLVNKLYKAGKLQPSFLMKCLHQGQSSLFEIAFAKLTRVPKKIMRAFLYDRGPEALAVSCCAAGIDRSVFLTIYQLTRDAQNMDTTLTDTEIATCFEYFNKYDKNRALMTIQKWVTEATHNTMF